jgi:hypothetical protein
MPAQTYTFSINQQTLIQAAFRLIGQFNDDTPPPPTDLANAAQALNLMIKYWMSKNYPLWCVTDLSFTVVQGQVQYLIGPGSPTPGLQAYRVLRIPMARLQYATPASNFPLQVPLIQLSRQEYDMMGQKTDQGTPNSYYYDPQLNNGVLSLYLAPDANPNIVILTCQRPIADVINSTASFDFPIEWLNALKWGLAEQLLPEYFVPESVAARVERNANRYLEDMLNWDQEEASTFFTPDRRGQGRSSY